MINRSQRIKKKYWVGVVRFTRQKKKPRRNFFPASELKYIWFLSDIFSHWLLRNLCYDSRHETAKFGENKIGGISRLFRIVAVFIFFLSQVEVGPLRNINFGIDYDAGNPFDTKITEPRVQTRLCLAETEGFEPSCPGNGQLHFECSSLRPLRYVSITQTVYQFLWGNVNRIAAECLFYFYHLAFEKHPILRLFYTRKK